ncbi:sugar transferase [Leucobacter soli]|uniref:sugar transferase n=1 Tax=Leucobacter soli TaxID=2812850 RepID=UPI001F3A5996|nr:sugar transferase [Leucobacter soli]
MILCSVSAGAAVDVGFRGASLQDLWFLPILALVWLGLLAAIHSREPSCLGTGTAEYRRVANATGLAFGVIAFSILMVPTPGGRSALVAALAAGMPALLLSRWIWRHWLHRQRLAGSCSSRTLVVGHRDDVAYVIRTLDQGGENGFQVVGTTLFDDSGASISVGESTFPALGDSRSVARAAQRSGADTIMVASRPEGVPSFVRELSWELEGTAIELVLSNRVTDVVGPRLSLRPIDGLPLLHIGIPSYEGGHHLLKRGLDLLVAFCGVAVTALIAPIVALLVLAESRGPVFFAQQRVGRDGRTFTMYKFRTMVPDAEARLADLIAENEGAGPLFKMKSDPRVTRVGAVLRKFSIDEFPQFWNVLRGDMSVVGPRPPLPSEVTAYDGAVVRRLYVKPGITGPWQVSGRSDLSWNESVRLDLSYVENWSVMNDLQIMWRTARVMLGRQGAY